jgi:chromosome segregation ATPase
MQAAEQLYGVTMEESGVTSIVRIDLSSADSFREKQEVG